MKALSSKGKFLSLLLGLSFVFTGCSTANKQKHQELQKYVREGKFDKGLALVQSKDFYAEENSKLLKLLELGMMHYYNANYYQALKSFDAAKELSDKLFTVSISKKITAAVSNDNEDNYYGEKYERSLIRLYQVFSHLALNDAAKYEAYSVEEMGADKKPVVKLVPEKSLSEKERRFHLVAARAVLLEWNSILDSYKATSGGKPTYKDDMMAKVFGAFVHERLGSSNDLQIAKGLYVEAKKILLKNFSIYKTYNLKNEDFIKEYSKLHLMNEKDVKAKFLKESDYYNTLNKYLDQRIANLKRKKKDNVYFMISHGFIASKEAKKIDFPLPVATIPSGISDKGGFIGFSGKVLNAAAGTIPKIYFELPSIPYRPVTTKLFTVVKDEAGKVISKDETALVDPLSEIAYHTLDEQSISNMAKVGARVAGKHLAALGAAYLIYEKQKGSLGEFGAMMLASGSYSAANKGIEYSEKADLRFWATLPSDYRLNSISLPPGKYTVAVVAEVPGGENLLSQKSFVIEKGKTKLVSLIAL
ncbi:hypothetical protein [Bacteriovorax sp. Seq25_V]|uniref:hypothetical protein n=1 Tax=Bacteriovorax sp. Seq25_V TaxID=1201288 RepID=UPI00038A0508|nr:hypothetical protein [Bacteriovorax sp. Seq25_V]EQC46625.1 hypothetical protein M900_2417 [Bacteriovorax sp. Seq25_V]